MSSPEIEPTEIFVKALFSEKNSILQRIMSHAPEMIARLRAGEANEEEFAQLMDHALTDAYYGLLLGLEGSALLGGSVGSYELTDPHGNSLNQRSDLGGYGWQYFQNGGREND